MLLFHGAELIIGAVLFGSGWNMGFTGVGIIMMLIGAALIMDSVTRTLNRYVIPRGQKDKDDQSL